MAKFTAGADLNIKWQGHSFVGTAGTTHRLTDALVEEFLEEVVPGIPGFAWVTQDELTSIVTLPIAQTDVTGLTAALAGKLSTSGGTVASNLVVTGTIDGGATTVDSLRVDGAVTVTSTAVIQGAATVQGAATLASAVITAGATASTIRLTSTGDASLASTDHGIQVGADSTANLAIDANEIQARSNGAAGTLNLQADGGRLVIGSGGVAMGGTSFPSSPSNNDLFYRTDYDLLFFYDGTRWLSAQLFRLDGPLPSNTTGFNATATASYIAAPVEGSDTWLVDLVTQFFVVTGGSALGASHKWVGTFGKRVAANTTTTISTVNIDSGSSNTWRTSTAAINALLNNGTTHYAIQMDWAKTGTPGNLFVVWYATYRIVAT